MVDEQSTRRRTENGDGAAKKSGIAAIIAIAELEWLQGAEAVPKDIVLSLILHSS